MSKWAVSCANNGGFVKYLALLLLLISPLEAQTLKDLAVKRRKVRSADDVGKIGCIHMESFPGDYWFESEGGSTVCGFYLISLPEHLIEIEFLDFNVACENGGLLAVLDGWETRGEIFPSSQDHLMTMEERYSTFCGADRPLRVITSSQNVALLQFRVPTAGQGFRVSVRFINNPEPCNVVSLENRGTYTLRNFGHKRNCSASFLYPEAFKILTINIGSSGIRRPSTIGESVRVKCSRRGLSNYVQFLGGEGLDSNNMANIIDLCGSENYPDFPPVRIDCSHTVVRLVSTERFHNSVAFSFDVIENSNVNGYQRCRRFH